MDTRISTILVIQRYSELGLGYENKFQTTSLSTMTLILCRRIIFSIENTIFNGFDKILYFGSTYKQRK